MNPFGTELQNSSDKGPFIPKTSILGFFGTLLVRALQPWPSGLEQISALHLIVKGSRVFPHPVIFLYDLHF